MMHFRNSHIDLAAWKASSSRTRRGGTKPARLSPANMARRWTP